MKRWLRRLWRLSVAVMVLALLVLVAWAWLVPPLVGWRIEQQLYDAGATYATVRVDRVGLRSAQLTSLVIGEEERLSVDAATVNYNLRDLLNGGRVETLTASGAQLVVSMRDGRLDVGELADLNFTGGPSTTLAMAGSADESTAPGRFPFDVIELHHSAVLVETDTALMRLPVQGLISTSGSALTLGVVAEELTRRARLSGQIERTPNGWTTDRLQLLVSGRDVVLAEQAVLDWQATINLRGSINGHDGRLEVSQGSRIEAARVAPHLQRIRASISDPLTFAFDTRDGAWAIEAGRIVLDAATDALDLPPARADRLSLNATLGFAGNNEAVHAYLADAAAVQLDNLRVANLALGAAQWRIGPPAGNAPALSWRPGSGGVAFGTRLAALQPTAEPAPDRRRLRPLGRADRADRHLAFADASGSAAAAIAEDELASALIPAFTAAAEQVALDLSGSFDFDAGLALAGRLHITDGSAEHLATDTAIQGLDAEIPITFNNANETDTADDAAPAAPAEAEADAPAAIGAPGRFRIQQVRWAGADLPGPTGVAAVSDRGSTLAADWQPLGPLEMSLAANADPANNALAVNAHLDRVRVIDPYLFADAIPALANWEIDGTFAADLTLDTNADGTFEPILTVDLEDAAVRNREYDAQFNGIDGRITLTPLRNPLTPPNQQLTIEQATIGKLELSDGLVAFRLESPREVQVERMRWNIGDESQFRVHGFRFNLDEPEIDADIFVERLKLDHWLTLLTNEAVTGQGELFGRIPLNFRFDDDRPRLALGQGFLYSRPGPGTLRVRDYALADQLLAQADLGPRPDIGGDELRERALSALADFEYSMVTFDLVESDQGVMLRAEVRGRGRSGDAPLEIGSLVFNIRGLNDAANELLMIEMTRQRAVDRALDSFFERARP